MHRSDERRHAALHEPHRSAPPAGGLRRRLGWRGGVLLWVVWVIFACGCTDLRDYTGTWSGPIVDSPNLREGFTANTRITLEVDDIDRSNLVGRITVTPAQEATAGFSDATLIPMTMADNDVLGNLDFDGDPVATYLFYVEPDDPLEEHATVLVSAHPKDRMQVRILRPGLYGVFRLRR